MVQNNRRCKYTPRLIFLSTTLCQSAKYVDHRSVTLRRQGCATEQIRREAHNEHHRCQAGCVEHLYQNVAKTVNSKLTIESLSRLECMAQRLVQVAASQRSLTKRARQHTRFPLPCEPNGYSLRRKLSICILAVDKRTLVHICGCCFFVACVQLCRIQDSATFSLACLTGRPQRLADLPSP